MNKVNNKILIKCINMNKITTIFKQMLRKQKIILEIKSISGFE